MLTSVRSEQLRGHAAMLVFSALVAGAFSFGAMAANDIAPAALNAVRFWIASAIIGGIVMARGGVPRFALAAPWRYLLLGAIFGSYFVLMFEGLKTAAPVSAAAVFTLTPLMAAGFGWLLLRQRITARIWTALAIGGAGALWVIFRADLAALLRFDVGRGEFIYFFGCAAHAVYTPLVRKLNRGESALVFTFGTLIGGAIVITAWGAVDIVRTDWANLPGIVWFTIAYVAIFASSASFVLMQYATLRLPSSKVLAYTFLTPSWVMLLELALGAPPPPIIVVAGIGLTLMALALLLRDEG